MRVRRFLIQLLFTTCIIEAFCQVDSQNLDKLYIRSSELFLSNKFDTAMALTNILMELDSNNCAYYLLKGNILTETDKSSTDSIEVYYNKSLQKGCDSLQVFLGMENLYFNKMVLDKALLYINKAIAIKPDSGYLYFRRASTKMLLDDKPGMKADLIKAKEKGYSDANIMLETIEKLPME